MIWFGIRLVVRSHFKAGWRVYFYNGSCWLHSPDGAWSCLWGGALFGPACDLEADRLAGIRRLELAAQAV